MYNNAPIIADLTTKGKLNTVTSSPDCFVRFVRFSRRDTRDYKDKRPQVKVQGSSKHLGIRHGIKAKSDTSWVTSSRTFDVVSDILACSVTKSKSSPTGSFTIILAPGDINYHHVLHPGDHVMIWMRRKVPQKVTKVGALGPGSMFTNHIDNGLKMYGVITDVRKSFTVQDNGVKTLRYKIQGVDFGYFFGASVYYNAVLAAPLSQFQVAGMALQGTGRALASLIPYNTGKTVNLLLDLYMGEGLPILTKGNERIDARGFSPNSELLLPKPIIDMFKIPGAKGNRTFTNILARRIYVENYNKDSKTGITPIDSKSYGRRPLQGRKMFKIEVGNNAKLWSILDAYANKAINEMFIDLKPAYLGEIGGRGVQSKKVYGLYPTFVLRQVPFSTDRAHKTLQGVPTTRFVELPRIKVPEKFILSEDLGRGDHERINFMEMFGTYPEFPMINTVVQMKEGNMAIDYGSIKRYGLRSIIPKTDHYVPSETDQGGPPTITLIPKWIQLLADWWLGAHIFESGTFTMVGIEEALSLGDNIEIERKDRVNELYHVEGYTHTYGVGQGGVKSFKTTVQVTRGQRVDELPVYASERIDPNDILDIGVSDHTEPGLARPNTEGGGQEQAIDAVEQPDDRTKEQD